VLQRVVSPHRADLLAGHSKHREYAMLNEATCDFRSGGHGRISGMRSGADLASMIKIQDSRPAGRLLQRRSFIAGGLGILACARSQPSEGSDSNNTLHVLKKDFERFRLDFNASRSKVRLVILLSPT
jgi:hypothetical protein